RLGMHMRTRLVVREHRVHELFRVIPLAKLLRTGERVLVRPLLVIEIVDKPGNSVQLLILAEAASVRAHRRLDSEHVAAEALTLHEGRHQLEGLVPGRKHGSGIDLVCGGSGGELRPRIRHSTGSRLRRDDGGGPQNSAFPGVRGKGMTSRMLAIPVTYWIALSKPRPNPACGTVP